MVINIALPLRTNVHVISTEGPRKNSVFEFNSQVEWNFLQFQKENKIYLFLLLLQFKSTHNKTQSRINLKIFSTKTFYISNVIFGLKIILRCENAK